MEENSFRVTPLGTDQKYRTLLEINNAIVSIFECDQLFKTITQEFQKVTDFDRTGITLYDAVKDNFKIYVLETTADLLSLRRGADIPRDSSGMGWAFDNKQPLYRPEIPGEKQFYEDEFFLNEGLRSVLYLPLITKAKVLGTFQIASKEPFGYSEDDIEFLLQVANQLAIAIENVLTYEEVQTLRDQLHKENTYLQEEIKTECNFEQVIGKDPRWEEILENVNSVAMTDSTVLLAGETGTGKEMIARVIHDCSHRRERPLIKVNCGALSPQLVESELFGHEKGSFTGATNKKIGRFELAHNGTIFLDEIGDISQDMQVKLLRVLQEQEFERVGGTDSIKVNVRVIAATNRNLKEAVQKETFRADLYYRLNVFPIDVPPLRERAIDIPPLAHYFLGKFARRMKKKIEGISKETIDRLVNYPWPGNVRELQNVIERGVVLSKSSQLEIAWLEPPLDFQPLRLNRRLSLKEVEREYILCTLKETKGVIGGKEGAASLLKLHPNTLRSRLKQLEITTPLEHPNV